MIPTIRIVPGARRELVDAAVEVLRDNPEVAREEIFACGNTLHQRQRLNLCTRPLPLSQLRLLLAKVATWEKQTARGWNVVDPPGILRDVAERASEWAPPGKIIEGQSIPACWCEPEVATEWLKATGWKIMGKRARRSGSDIPAPHPGKFYDLHDVAFEDRIGASEVVRRIVEWSSSPGVANVAKNPDDGFPTFQQVEALCLP